MRVSKINEETIVSKAIANGKALEVIGNSEAAVMQKAFQEENNGLLQIRSALFRKNEEVDENLLLSFIYLRTAERAIEDGAEVTFVVENPLFS